MWRPKHAVKKMLLGTKFIRPTTLRIAPGYNDLPSDFLALIFWE